MSLVSNPTQRGRRRDIAQTAVVGALAFVLVGGCAPSNAAMEAAYEQDEQRCGQDELERERENCSMAGEACPSPGLPRFSTELDAEQWTRLRGLAEQGVVAVVLGESIELLEYCRIPGRYHEAAAAESSPGRAWASDRLVHLPDEPQGCDRATHFVASFAIRGDADGEAIALPLPCPPMGRSELPIGCIGAGQSDAERMAAAKLRWEQVESYLDTGDAADIDPLPLFVEIAALLPDPWSYSNLADALRFSRESHGGCLWQSEAEFAGNATKPKTQSSSVDPTEKRVAVSHELWDCASRPSLLTCFPDRFIPGHGGNCW